MQGVAVLDLLPLVQDGNLVVRMKLGIGSFAAEGAPLVSVASYDARQSWLPDATSARPIDNAYDIGRHRTLDQDSSFGLR